MTKHKAKLTAGARKPGTRRTGVPVYAKVCNLIKLMKFSCLPSSTIVVFYFFLLVAWNQSRNTMVRSLFIPNSKGRYAQRKGDFGVFKSSRKSNKPTGTISLPSSFPGDSTISKSNGDGNNRKKSKIRVLTTKKVDKLMSKQKNKRMDNFSSNRRTKKNLYLNGGYTYGDNKSLRQIWEICSNDKTKKLNWEYLETSRYLRFWPGKKDDAESIWMNVCGEDGCSLESLLNFHKALDTEAALIYENMDEERVQWDEENLVSDLLEKYFSKACNKIGRLEFKQFMAWDVVASEIWYGDLENPSAFGREDDANSKDGDHNSNAVDMNTESQISIIWGKYADEDNTVSYDDFRTIYECICADKLTLYSSDFKPCVKTIENKLMNDDDEEILGWK